MALCSTLQFQGPELSSFDVPLSGRWLLWKEYQYEWELRCDQWSGPLVGSVRREHHEVRKGCDAMVQKLLDYLGVEGNF